MHPYIHAQTHPDKPAYVMAAPGETVTYGELDERSNRVAQLFRSLGLRRGDHIAILLENHPRFFEIVLGARSGPACFYTADQLAPDRRRGRVHRQRLRREGVRHLDDLADVAAGVATADPGRGRLLMIDGAIDGFELYEDAVARAARDAARRRDRGHDMLYSSGTTGRPKGVAAAGADAEPIDADNRR